MAVSSTYVQNAAFSALRTTVQAATPLYAEIERLIGECRADMIQKGVPQYKAEDETDSLIYGAVRCYIRAHFSNEGKESAYDLGNYRLMVDEIRKDAQ